MLLEHFKKGAELEEALVSRYVRAFRIAFTTMVFLPGTLPVDVWHLAFPEVESYSVLVSCGCGTDQPIT